MKELLEKNVFSHINLTDKEYFSARSYFKSKKLKKLEILHFTNVVCNNIYFIESGIIRYYQMNDGKEVTGGFFFAGDWYNDLFSFFSNSNTKQTAQALEDSTLLFISKQDLDKLYEELPKTERFGRIIAEQTLIELRKKMDDLTLLNAKDRYLNLIKNSPKIIKKIPQHYIASYLGIKPESLSRIRKNLYF
tara:strand:- start:1693 stop:2265 length:573 start_codon:yes stop_codon:yes gene_type:complete